ncbi:GntR family transcriptional regulator [Micromonospora sp. NPDC048830]|uniref:GntR family transcriptional regulator n=1 Tax=Micromonospora sp. NPDC048830 TaxID=3364257 RepID=UPI0037153FFC
MPEQPAMPLHEQIRNVLLHEIESGAYDSGGRLPTEPELCEQFGVSRITVRRAVSDLEEMGLVHRKQGVGTFVATRRAELGTMSVGGFSDQLSGAGTPSRSIVVSEVIPADTRLAHALAIKAGADVFHLVRIFLMDGLPLAMDDSCYALDRFPGFDGMIDDMTSTYRVLRKHYGVQIVSVEREIGIAFTNAQSARWLDRPERDPLILIEKTATDRDGSVVHVSRVECVPTRMRLRSVVAEDTGA